MTSSPSENDPASDRAGARPEARPPAAPRVGQNLATAEDVFWRSLDRHIDRLCDEVNDRNSEAS